MNLSQAEKKIGIEFKDKNLLKQAFTHRSYLNENRDKVKKHNERLEFLGDAVLELVSTELLFKKYPNRDEGELTAFRAALVNTQSISEAASKLGFNEFLLLSKGESKDTGRARQYILANTYESVIGAIYLDQGYDPSKKFIEDTLFWMIDEIVAEGLWVDAKSLLQEKSQEIRKCTPSYKILHEEGPDHDKEFMSAVYFNDEMISKGKGNSKQEAQQDAARNALKKLGWIDN